MERCRTDISYWFRNYLWTYDPRLDDTDIRFALWPKQAELLEWIKERERLQKNGLIEKARDSGVTFECGGYALHGWLFRKGFAAGFGSRKLELVDEIGNMDSIFEKIRFMLERLPDWMIPAGYDRKRHDNFAKLIHPSNGSTITGEGGDEIGRGGRKTIYFVDESAFLARPKRAEGALKATTKVRIDVSTPNAPGDVFFTKRHSGKVEVFSFRWQDDPRKTQEWADEEKELDPATFAREYDLDYSASVEGICIPARWVRAAVDFQIPDISNTYPMVAGFDVAEEGSNKSVFLPRRGPVVLDPTSWGQLNTTQSAWKAADIAEKLGVEAVFFDAIGVGAGIRGTWESSERKLRFKAYPVKWGDPATEQKWPSGKSSRETFVNLRAELWWILRSRFEKTFEYVTQGVQHPADELISIPNNPQLIADLSVILYQTNSTGKIQLESKPDLKKRGVASPDFGDALAYSFAPQRSEWKFY